VLLRKTRDNMATATEKTAPADDDKDTFITDDTAPRSTLKKTIDEKLLKHSHDADAAMTAFQGMDGQVIELTEEKNKALLRKIDMHLMPVRWLYTYHFDSLLTVSR
jgi:ACS family allantoate permease-like MFS transporter